MPPKIRYGLVGDPIEHSLSPVMHNAAFESMNMNAEYLLRPSKLEDAEAIHRELIHGRWAGLNVTTPLKTTLAGLVELKGTRHEPVPLTHCGAMETRCVGR